MCFWNACFASATTRPRTLASASGNMSSFILGSKPLDLGFGQADDVPLPFRGIVGVGLKFTAVVFIGLPLPWRCVKSRRDWSALLIALVQSFQAVVLNLKIGAVSALYGRQIKLETRFVWRQEARFNAIGSGLD